MKNCKKQYRYIPTKDVKDFLGFLFLGGYSLAIMFMLLEFQNNSTLMEFLGIFVYTSALILLVGLAVVLLVFAFTTFTGMRNF